ncbi:hypothetical protein JHK87_050526 [Glycine soja]|nr:hypothetical protein JHK87_050526 [Glycine soja]
MWTTCAPGVTSFVEFVSHAILLFEELTWSIWKATNLLVFNQKRIPVWVTLDMTTRLHIQLQAKLAYCIISHSWSKPWEGFVKANLDASIVSGKGTSLGIIFHNHSGEVLTANVWSHPRDWLPSSKSYFSGILHDCADLFGSNFASFFFTFVNRLANLTVIADKLPKLAFLSFDLEVPSLDGKFG